MELKQPIQNEAPVDMTEFEFAPSAEAQADLASMEAQEDLQPVVGFNQDLMMLYLRATPGSEFAKNIENAMMADFVVNNAVAYGLVSAYEDQIDRMRDFDDEEVEKKNSKEKVLA